MHAPCNTVINNVIPDDESIHFSLFFHIIIIIIIMMIIIIMIILILFTIIIITITILSLTLITKEMKLEEVCANPDQQLVSL